MVVEGGLLLVVDVSLVLVAVGAAVVIVGPGRAVVVDDSTAAPDEHAASIPTDTMQRRKALATNKG